jgi:type I restriction enzyme R subunit
MANTHKNLKEEAFEVHIKDQLVEQGYRERHADASYDAGYALDPELLFEFLYATQSQGMKRLEEMHGSSLKDRILRRVDAELTARGLVDVLRKGFEEGPVHLQLICFRPVTSLNSEVAELYKKNIWSVMRQVKFSKETEQSLDLALFVNGLPIVTAELKNEITGQNVRHAMRQYRTDRSPDEKLFSFRRCAAHFAVDTSEVYLTTHLKEDRTFFLPFNRGDDNGAGNPAVESKHKTFYLWEEVWSPDNLSDLLQFFVHAFNEIREDRTGKTYTLPVQVFPRYHQWRTVIELLRSSRDNGAGSNYLIQHSAGSGKSMTIAWLAYRLAELHNSQDEKVFDTVLVLTDRRVLDKQLRDTVSSFGSVPGVLLTVGDQDTSAKLKEGLEGGAKIITTTIQKFPVIVDAISSMTGKKFALIVDEAHSSQSGETARAIHEVIGESEEDVEDWLLKQMNSRRQPSNLSYYAFTATPKHETLERFGEKEKDGSFCPFSLYSMRQAIDEGFILDVLSNYSTYKTYFSLVKNAVNDPMVPRSQALSTILRHVNLHDETIDQKVEVVISHFDLTVSGLLGGESKAMIVTSSREAAARYKLALDHYLREHNYPYKTLAAFTDSIEIDGQSYTETSINDGIPESNTAREFKKPEYRFLIVAEKYQTGFDEPYLCAMYVDKHLSGVGAVQTLSRLNRTTREKDDVFVLDFVNETDDIKKAFEPYYTTTILSEGTDINTLNDLRRELFVLYPIPDAGLDVFVGLIDPEAEDIHEETNAFLDELANRISSTLSHGTNPEAGILEENQYGAYLAIASSYVRRYPFVAQVLGYSDVSHEKLYLLLKYLLKKLPRDPRQSLADILQYLDLKSVRVVKKIKTHILLDAGAGDVRTVDPIPGAPMQETEDILSKLIQDVNKKWGVDFGLEQQETLTSMSTELAGNDELQNVVTNNTKQNAAVHFGSIFEEKVDDQFEGDRKLWEQLTNNKDLRGYIERKMFTLVFEKILKNRGE